MKLSDYSWLIGLVVSVLFVGGLWYYIVEYDFYSDDNIDFFVTNHSWWEQSSGLLSYSSGDRLEYTFLYKHEDGDVPQFDQDRLQNRLNLKDIDIQKGYDDWWDRWLLYLEIEWIAQQDWQTNITRDEISGYLQRDFSQPDNNQEEDSDIDQKNDKVENTDQNDEEQPDQNDLDINTDNLGLNTYSLYDTQSQLLEVQGYEYVDSVSIWSEKINLDGKYINVDGSELDIGLLGITYHLINDETVQDEQNFEILSMWDRSVGIYDFNPDTLYGTGERYLSVQGYGFDRIVAIQLSSSEVIGQTDFELVSDRLMGVQIPSDIELGEYHLNVMVDDGIYRLKDQTFEILPEE